MAKGIRQVTFRLTVPAVVVPLDGLQAQLNELMDVARLRLLEAAEPDEGYTLNIRDFKIGKEVVDEHQLALLTRLSCPRCDDELTRLKGLMMLSLRGIRHPDRELERGVACGECGGGDVRVVLPPQQVRAWVEDALPPRSTPEIHGPSKREAVIGLAVLAAVLLGLGYGSYRLYRWWRGDPSSPATLAQQALQEQRARCEKVDRMIQQDVKSVPDRAAHIKQMLAITNSGAPKECRHKAMNLMAEVGGKASAPALLGLLDHQDEQVRLGAVAFLRRLGGEGTVRVMKARLASAVPGQRIQAIRVLEKVGGAGSVDLLLPLLKDPTSPVAKQAAKSLGSIGDSRALSPLLKAQQPLDAEKHHGFVWAARYAVLHILRDNDHEVSAPGVNLRGTISGWRPSRQQKMSSYFWRSMDQDLDQALAKLRAAGAPAPAPVMGLTRVSARGLPRGIRTRLAGLLLTRLAPRECFTDELTPKRVGARLRVQLDVRAGRVRRVKLLKTDALAMGRRARACVSATLRGMKIKSNQGPVHGQAEATFRVFQPN